MIPRYHIVAEREHEIQSPTSEEKLLLLGRRLGLGSGSRVLDIASGGGGPALVLAEAFGCRIDGIEIAPEFHAAAVERAQARELSQLVSFRLADVSREALPADEYDAALCLGASLVYGSRRHPPSQRALETHVPPPRTRLRGLGDLRRLEDAR